MILTSSLYLTFLIALLFLYYLVPKKTQWILLLISSLLFIYVAANDIKVYIYVISAILISFLGSHLIERQEKEKGKKLCQTVTVTLMVLQLLSLKYFNFSEKLVPIGITFYTLIAIGYVIDVGRGITSPEKNIFKYSLFVLYFPQLTSGPFTRYYKMEKALFSKHRFRFKNICFGFQRIIWGFFKKLIIAERLAIMVGTVFEDYMAFPGIYTVIAAVSFAIELYADFSGCMDIVLGTSEALGIKLPENFQTPFFAKNISEYWRRWHITLGTWFKDYYFYPLLKSNIFQKIREVCKNKFGKKYAKKIPTYLGMFVLWFTVGAWHGGAWHYIIGSGILHWFYIVTGELLKPKFDIIAEKLHIRYESTLFKLWQILRTFILVCIGDVFFRASTSTDALKMLKNIFVSNYAEIFKGAILKFGLDVKDLIVLLIALIALFIVSLNKRKGNVREKLLEKNIIIRYGIWILLIASIIVFGYYGQGYDAAGFIYQNF